MSGSYFYHFAVCVLASLLSVPNPPHSQSAEWVLRCWKDLHHVGHRQWLTLSLLIARQMTAVAVCFPCASLSLGHRICDPAVNSDSSCILTWNRLIRMFVKCFNLSSRQIREKSWCQQQHVLWHEKGLKHPYGEKKKKKKKKSNVLCECLDYAVFCEILVQRPIQRQTLHLPSRMTAEDLTHMRVMAQQHFDQIMAVLKDMPRCLLLVIRWGLTARLTAGPQTGFSPSSLSPPPS